jgi:hypothetical protein
MRKYQKNALKEKFDLKRFRGVYFIFTEFHDVGTGFYNYILHRVTLCSHGVTSCNSYKLQYSIFLIRLA